MVPGMSRKGDCWDNAVAESFFGKLKTELVHLCKFQNGNAARSEIFAYMEGCFNKRRLHSYLDYDSPVEFETMQAAA